MTTSGWTRRFAPLAAAFTVAVLLPVGNATATEGCRLLDPEDAATEICRVVSWFHAGDLPVGNLSAIPGLSSLVAGPLPTWDSTPPATATTDGGGAASISEELLSGNLTEGGEPIHRAVFEGVFTGNIETLGFQLYVAEPHRYACPPFSCYPTITVRDITVKVDGVTLYNKGRAFPVDAETEFLRLDLAIPDLYRAMTAQGLSTGPQVQHSLRIEFFTGEPTIFQYDATDVPSQIIFNPLPEELESYVLFPT